MKKIATAILLLIAVASSARISFIEISDIETWEKMLRLARAQNKSLMLVLYSDQTVCEECRTLYHQTFRNRELASYINQEFIPLESDINSSFAKGLSSLFTDVGDTPEIMVFNNNEQLFYRKKGRISAEDLKTDLEITSKNIAAYPTWQRQLAVGEIALDDWIHFQLIEYTNSRLTPSSPDVRKLAARLDSASFSNPLVLRYIYKLGVDVDFPIYQTLAKHNNWITDTNFDWELYYSRVFSYNIFRAISSADSILLEDIIIQLKKINFNILILNLELKGRQLFLAELARWPAYDSITRGYLNSLPADSANAWQREAIYLMEFYPQEVPNGLALNYLREGLRKAETFELYYTLSLWLFDYGDYLNAYKAAYRSYETARTTEQRELGARMVLMLERY